MERGQSSSDEDINNAFPSERKSDCGKENSTNTSTYMKENVEENLDSSAGSSVLNKIEREVSQPDLYSKSEELPIEYENNKRRILCLDFYDETELEFKDSLLQKFSSDISDKTVSEIKDNSTSIFRPVIPDEGSSESKANLTSISRSVFPDEGSSENKADVFRIASLEGSNEAGLESKIGSLQICSPDENVSGNNTILPLMSSIMISSEGAAENSTLLSRITAFFASRKGCLSLQGNGPFVELSEKPTRNISKRERKKDARRQKRNRLLSKDNQNKGDDCQAVSPSQTENIPTEWKLSSFKSSRSVISEEIATETKCNLTRKPILKVADVAVSESENKFLKTCSLETSDATSLEKEFSSLQITNPVNPDEVPSENSASLPLVSIAPVYEGDLLNSIRQLKINVCEESVLRRNSFQEIESSFNTLETSTTEKITRKYRKAARKQISHQSSSKINRKEPLLQIHQTVSPTMTEEFRTEDEGYSPRISKSVVSDESASENEASLPVINEIQDLDEDTLRNLAILSSEGLCWLPTLQQRSSISFDTTEGNKALRNLTGSTSHSEPTTSECPDDFSIFSTSKISPSEKSDQKSKSLKLETDPNDRYNLKKKLNYFEDRGSSFQSNQNLNDSMRDSGRNRSRQVYLAGGNTRTPFNTSDIVRPVYFELDDRIFMFPVLNNPLRNIRSGIEPPDGNTQNTSETNRNRTPSSSSITDNKETDRNRSQTN